MKQFTIFSNALGFRNYQLWAYERMRYVGDWKSCIHNHSYMEIFFFTDGEGILRTVTKDFSVKKGMVAIVNPLSLHTEISHPVNALEYAVFSINGIYFKQDNNSEENKEVFIFDYSDDFEKLFDILRIIEREEVEKKMYWQFAVLNEVDKFLLFILRNSSITTHPYDSGKKTDAISNIHLYLTSRYQDEITLEKISKLFYLNKYYISHAFKEKYGKTVFQELMEIRCTEAEHLLNSTNLSISEVAIGVGFNSVSYFSKTYKKIKHETPEQTRKKK